MSDTDQQPAPDLAAMVAAMVERLRADGTALGARLIAISPQAPDASQPLVQRLGLTYDVLSDLDQSVIRDYRLQFALDEDLRSTYRGFNMALDEQNADGTWNLPVPATFILDQDGIVRDRHVEPNYRDRMTVDAIVAALADISSQRT